MAFTPLGKGGTPGVPYTVDTIESYQDWNRVKDNFNDHETRIVAVEGATGAVGASVPSGLADDHWVLVTDGGSPETFSIAIKRSGLVKLFPIGSWV